MTAAELCHMFAASTASPAARSCDRRASVAAAVCWSLRYSREKAECAESQSVIPTKASAVASAAWPPLSRRRAAYRPKNVR